MMMTMLMANIHQVKTDLSRYLKRLKKGERLLICNRNEPVAELRLIDKTKRRRRFGTFKGQVRMSSDFDELPEELLKAFNGES